MKRIAAVTFACFLVASAAFADPMPNYGGGPSANTYRCVFPPAPPTTVDFYVSGTGNSQHLVGSAGGTAFDATYDPETFCHSDACNDFHYVGGQMQWRHKLPDGSWSGWATATCVQQ